MTYVYKKILSNNYPNYFGKQSTIMLFIMSATVNSSSICGVCS